MINALLKEVDPTYIVLNITNPKLAFDEIVIYLARKLRIVTKDKEITGILRISDVFAAVYHEMKHTDLS